MSLRHTSILVPSLAVLALVAGILWLPPDVFWITDEGTKYIQLQSYVRTGEVAIDYPSTHLDPDRRLLPDAGHHLLRYGPKIHSLFLPYFAFLSTAPYQMSGIYGIYFWPALAALGTLILILCFQRQIFTRSYPFDLLLLLFGTPLYFYSITYWEHLPALLFSTAACGLLLTEQTSEKWRVVVAGMLLAISTLLREEGYVFTIAAALSLLFVDRNMGRAVTLLLSFSASMVIPWWWQSRVYGSFLGPHGQFYSGYSAVNITEKVQGVYEHLFRIYEHDLVNLLLALPFLAAVVSGVPSQSRFRKAILILSAISSAVSVYLLTISTDRIFQASEVKGLFIALPWLVVVLFSYRSLLAGENRKVRFLAATSLLFVLGALAILRSTGTWIIWGPRFFIPVFPLMLILFRSCYTAIEEDRSSRVVIGILVICSVAIQANGIYNLALKKNGTKRIQQAVMENRTGVVLTDVFWVPQELASLFYQKHFLYVRSDKDLKFALERLQSHGIREFTFVAAREYRKLSDQPLREMLKTCVQRTHVLTPEMRFMEVMVLKCVTSASHASSPVDATPK